MAPTLPPLLCSLFSLFAVVAYVSSASNATSGPSEDEMRVHKENKQHIEEAIDSLLNPDDLVTDHEEAGKIHPMSLSSERLTLSTSGSGDDYISQNEADIYIMNQTFQLFSRPRSDGYSKREKDSARQAIIAKLREYKAEAFVQTFTSRKRGNVYKGQNIIGIVPGKLRGKAGDEIVLVGAHYDTVDTSPGVDDNGSGVVAILEVARLLSSQPQLPHTVMLVAFDLEELGLLGSNAFVREYLIPKELIGKKATFLGAYVIDMVLNYDSTPGSQILPRDIQSGTPEVTRRILGDGNRGDFVAVWMRKNVDDSVWSPLKNSWSNSNNGSYFKLRPFEPLLPSKTPSSSELYRFGTFTRSDHASFWYHKHQSYPQTLNAVLLTDMGPWRGTMNKKCYHSWCDDDKQLNPKNLAFLKHTIDMLANVVSKNPPKAQTTNPGVNNRRGFRGFRGGRRGYWY